MADFTPTEHELLISLYRAKGGVVLYNRLMEESGVISRRALWVAVSRLRTKVDRPIECRPGFGYRL